jgi:hypothetical protein
MQYTPDNAYANITSFGDFPMIWITNNGTDVGFSTQSAVNSGEPRDVAGFGTFTLSLLDSTTTNQYVLVESVNENQMNDFVIFPNPANDQIQLRDLTSSYAKIQIYTLDGKLVLESNFYNNPIDVTNLSPGSYIINAISNRTSMQKTTKLIIQ